MNDKNIIKSHLIDHPIDQRARLIEFIDITLKEKDIQSIMMYLLEKGLYSYKISDLSYSESGDLNLKIETSVEFIN